MTPFARQFDEAQYDPHWMARGYIEDDRNPFWDDVPEAGWLHGDITIYQHEQDEIQQLRRDTK